MLFSSITFLYIFLPVVLLLYYIAPRRLKNYILLLGSLIFYFFGEPVYVLLLIFSSLSDWLHSLYIEKHRGERSAKAVLISSIIINLAMLGFFKYADFIIASVNTVLGISIPLLNVPLPIGISFFTFQTMSYTIDVYRGSVHAQRSIGSFATFVCLFPQLIAGPVVRYSDIAEDLESRRHTMDDIAAGIRRFTFGLAKKVLIANSMGELCSAFRSSGEETVLFFWVYAAAFLFQIYFDFSGYSDMAIGLGRMLGFKFPENFNYPYMSRSITEFWRRWHMTLGGWFRDYVYIPLGGNRCSRAKWLRNIAVVWLLTGLWHGAEWNFVLWGVIFGAVLWLEKLWLGNILQKAGRIIPHVYVVLLVMISMVIFNADGLSGAVSDISGMFSFASLPLSGPLTVYYLKSYAVLLIIAAVGCTDIPKRLYSRISSGKAVSVLEPASVAVILISATAYLVNGSFNPFLYFRF